jgi:hypothetical protein
LPLVPGFEGMTLRDFGLSLGALALARLVSGTNLLRRTDR